MLFSQFLIITIVLVVGWENIRLRYFVKNLSELTDEEENAALKAAKSLGLGICGVDMLQSARGPLILEVNSSPGLEGIEAATKKDIAKSIIRYIERNV